MGPVTQTVVEFHAFVLVLFRVTGLMVVTPFWGGESIPIQIRIALGLAIALLLVPVVPHAHVGVPGDLYTLALEAGSETIVGLLVGLGASFVFSAVQLAGQQVGQQIGFSIANVIDPISNVEVSVVGHLMFVVALFVFLGMDAHLLLFRVFAASFHAVPLGLVTPSRGVVGAVAAGPGSMVERMLDASFQIGAPTVVALLLVTVGMGILARAVPEMNIFVIGFPLRIAVGFVVLIVSLPVLAIVLERLFETAVRDAETLVRLLGPVTK